MKHYALVLVAIAILLLAMPSQLFAVSANPNPITTTQPDGTELTIRIFGDEWYHFYETEDGYAILQKDDGWWVYADLDASGRYVPSEFRVNKSAPGLESFLNSKGKHLKEDEKYRIESREKFFKKTMPGILEEAKRLGKAKGLKNMNVPVILIRYPNYSASQTRQSFDDMMNLNNYNGTGSFRNYYQQVSYNNLTVTATVVGWYTAPNNRSYYAWSTGDPTRYNRVRELVRSAVDAAEVAGMNFANFDNDGDDTVDVVFTVHQGPGAEGGDSAFIWSHAWYLNPGGGWSNLSVTYDGGLIDRYIIMPEISYFGGHIEIGVFCHEFGHALGLPDLYDIKNPPTSEGVGLWDLMGSGSWGGNQTSPQFPTHMSAWCKSQQGWITPTNVTVNTIGQIIQPVENNATAFRLWTNGAAGPQYFLVEFRKKTGFDINLPTEGLAIWHIDDSKTDAWGRPTNQDENRKAVDLEEADGLNHLDNQVNRGDAGDLFPGSSNNKNFNNNTNPNSKDYTGGNTLVQVNNIASGASYTANLYVQVVVPPPDLVIRDCASDIGNEPDNQCFNNWVQSPDIWVDNNDDNIIDEPVKEQVNHLYIRSWNIGGTTTPAWVRCWYVAPSMGLRFPGSGTQIWDTITFESFKTIPGMGTTSLPPSNPTGYRVYFNWLIPTPPPNVDHYCIGCVISNAADPQVSQVPLQENNLGQINYWALALKKGQTPFGLMTAGPYTETIFREKVRVNNPLDSAQFFVVTYDSVPGWIVHIDDPGPFYLMPDSFRTITIDVTRAFPQHRDSATIGFQLHTWPDTTRLVGGLWHDYRIDDVPPAMPDSFDVRVYQLLGDNYPRPAPTVELTWFDPKVDSLGFPEKVNYYKIYRSTDPLLMPDESKLVGSTALDRDLFKPGYQWWDYEIDVTDSTYYYAVVAVDKTGSAGKPTPFKPVLPLLALLTGPIYSLDLAEVKSNFGGEGAGDSYGWVWWGSPYPPRNDLWDGSFIVGTNSLDLAVAVKLVGAPNYQPLSFYNLFDPITWTNVFPNVKGDTAWSEFYSLNNTDLKVHMRAFGWYDTLPGGVSRIPSINSAVIQELTVTNTGAAPINDVRSALFFDLDPGTNTSPRGIGDSLLNTGGMYDNPTPKHIDYMTLIPTQPGTVVPNFTCGEQNDWLYPSIPGPYPSLDSLMNVTRWDVPVGGPPVFDFSVLMVPAKATLNPGESFVTTYFLWSDSSMITDAGPNTAKKHLFDLLMYIGFFRGDVDCNGKLNLADVIYLANYILKAGPSPEPFADQGNLDGSHAGSQPNLADVIYLANYILKSGPAPFDFGRWGLQNFPQQPSLFLTPKWKP